MDHSIDINFDWPIGGKDQKYKKNSNPLNTKSVRKLDFRMVLHNVHSVANKENSTTWELDLEY